MSGTYENHVDKRVKEIRQRMIEFKQRKKQMK